MSIARYGGPLATPGPADVNYTIDGPGHRLLMKAFGRRVRGTVGDATVFDTTGGALLHESNLGPVLYVPRDDVHTELTRSETVTHCPFKGDATHWHGAGVEDLAWEYEAPIETAPYLKGRVAFYTKKLTTLLDEDEQVRALRDPYHRTDVRRTSRRVTVTLGGETIVETTDALVLSETGLAERFYVPQDAVRAELAPSARTSHCPYKGDASYWNVGGVEDAAWSYPEPYDEVRPIAGYVSFDGDGLATTVS